MVINGYLGFAFTLAGSCFAFALIFYFAFKKLVKLNIIEV